jgi:hypothetical protein
MDRVLIIYSNPSDTDRLRLDKEHRAIDEVLSKLQLPQNTVTRRHATTFEDLVKALAEFEYSIIQFSGHGSNQGIYLEGLGGVSGQLITPQQLTRLLSETQPNLKAAILMCCFSADSLPVLIDAAPYLVTVFGPADDNSSINFVRLFYEFYFKNESIETSYLFAQELASSGLQTVLSRRALDEAKGRILFQIFPKGDHFGDTILIDLNDAENDIKELGISRENFLAILSRKIRLHHRIFDHPRDQAIIPIGRFVGIFSWQNVKDVIQCHRVLRMKAQIDDETCTVWARLTVIYNENAMQKYRLIPQSDIVFSDKSLERAIRDFQADYRILSARKEDVKVLSQCIPEQYSLSKSLMVANLEMAERKFDSEDFGSAVVYLESVLSAMHDLLDALTDAIAMDPTKEKERVEE